MSFFFHEQLYRSPELMASLKDFAITVCGAGALGANITENLARAGCGKLRVIDYDRIEEQNLSTQPYYKSDVGAYKAKIVTNSLYRALGVVIDGRSQKLTADNCKQLLGNSDLVIDAFDNSMGRQIIKDYCQEFSLPCLHTGLAKDYSEIIWNDVYRVPSDVNDDVCDYALARNLVMLTVAVACEIIVNFIATKKQQSYTLTLGDFAIKPFQT